VTISMNIDGFARQLDLPRFSRLARLASISRAALVSGEWRSVLGVLRGLTRRR